VPVFVACAQAKQDAARRSSDNNAVRMHIADAVMKQYARELLTLDGTPRPVLSASRRTSGQEIGA